MEVGRTNHEPKTRVSAVIVPRGYVEDGGRPLDGALQGEPSNRPKRLGLNGRGRERWGKRRPRRRQV